MPLGLSWAQLLLTVLHTTKQHSSLIQSGDQKHGSEQLVSGPDVGILYSIGNVNVSQCHS